MLTTFSMKNFGPYRDMTTLDMRAVPSYKEHEYNLADPGNGDSILKVAVVYGANASGKSRLVEAYYWFGRIVEESFKSSSDTDDGRSIVAKSSFLSECYHPFALCNTKEPTEFEATFVTKDGSYRYGFAYDATAIHSEWLYFTNSATNRMSIILERTIEDGIHLGQSVRRECSKYLPNIPSDVLVLSFFSSFSLKNEVFAKAHAQVFSFLAVPGLVVDRQLSDFLNVYFTNRFNDETKKLLLSFLKQADMGIDDIEVEKGEGKPVVWMYHKGPDGNAYRLPLSAESDGTKKMIALQSYLSVAVSGGFGIIIDELDAELHPLIVRFIVSLFHSQDTQAQLIFTAHDLSLLDKRYLRRDQVWFVSKDTGGVATLHSLADYRVRNDASFVDAYLSGVFGAIPNIAKE